MGNAIRLMVCAFFAALAVGARWLLAVFAGVLWWLYYSVGSLRKAFNGDGPHMAIWFIVALALYIVWGIKWR